MVAAVKLNAVLVHREEANPRLMILRVAPEGWELPRFEPGQYVALGIPRAAPRIAGADPDGGGKRPNELIVRAYSIASSSRDKEYLEFYVNLVDSGTFTPRLFALKTGDRLWMKNKIKGVFTLRQVPEKANVLMVATGTGLAPYMSMLRTDPGCHGDRRYAVLLGARHARDLGYHREMSSLQAQCRNVSYVPIISRPKEEETTWDGAVGHVQDLWQEGVIDRLWGFHPHPDNTHVFLCGNPEMISEMRQSFEAQGFALHSNRSPGQLHIEEYW